MTTPLLRTVMGYVAEDGMDPTEIQWFDITGAIDRSQTVTFDPLIQYRPPFEKCMFVWEGMTKKGPMQTFILVAGTDPEEGIAVAEWFAPPGKRPKKIPLFYYVNIDGVLHHAPAEGEKITEQEMQAALGMVAAWLQALAFKMEVHRPVLKQTFTNRRKIAAGKTPTYDWTTVVIDPIKPISTESKGGTHASPRQHDVRGHYVKSKLGKLFWRKAHKRGDPTLGTVFHDYVVRSAACPATTLTA